MTRVDAIESEVRTSDVSEGIWAWNYVGRMIVVLLQGFPDEAGQEKLSFLDHC